MIKTELQHITNIINNSFDDPLGGSIKIFLNSGTKQIRSKLAILYFKSLGYELNENIYNILACGEIIHNASLLHDDIIDEASIRRNIPTLHKQFSEKIAILSGDFLLSIAGNLLFDINNKEITTIFFECIKSMCNAEFRQYFLRGKLPTEDQYINICRDKTARLFMVIMESCAIELNSERKSAKDIGEIFGILFQFHNDQEVLSIQTDKQNKIYTSKDIIGIEKTNILSDNYKRELDRFMEEIPKNIYKKELESIIKGL